MLSLSLLPGLSTFATSASSYIRDISNTTTSSTTSLPGRYLPENITTRTSYNDSCTAETVSIRKEWRSFTDSEKEAFVDAKICLMALPNQTDLPGATTRFDKLEAAHQQGTNTTYRDVIHYTVSSSCPTLTMVAMSTYYSTLTIIPFPGNVPGLA